MVFVCMKCNESGGSFAEETHLDAHIRSFHLNWNPFECWVCSVGSPSELSLQSHIGQFHPNLQYKLTYIPNEDKMKTLQHLKEHGTFPYEISHLSQTSTTQANRQQNPHTSSVLRWPLPNTYGNPFQEDSHFPIHMKNESSNFGSQTESPIFNSFNNSQQNYRPFPSVSTPYHYTSPFQQTYSGSRRTMFGEVEPARSKELAKPAATDIFKCPVPGCSFSEINRRRVRWHHMSDCHPDYVGRNRSKEPIPERRPIPIANPVFSSPTMRPLSPIVSNFPSDPTFLREIFEDDRPFVASSPVQYRTEADNTTSEMVTSTTKSNHRFLNSTPKVSNNTNQSSTNKEVSNSMETDENSSQTNNFTADFVFTPPSSLKRQPKRPKTIGDNVNKIENCGELGSGTERKQQRTNPVNRGMRKRNCKVCYVTIQNTNWKRHIYSSHVKKPAIKCPYEGCNKSDYYSLAPIARHIRDRHSSKSSPAELRTPIIDRDRYHSRFMEWSAICEGEDEKNEDSEAETRQEETSRASCSTPALEKKKDFEGNEDPTGDITTDADIEEPQDSYYDRKIETQMPFEKVTSTTSLNNAFAEYSSESIDSSSDDESDSEEDSESEDEENVKVLNNVGNEKEWKCLTSLAIEKQEIEEGNENQNSDVGSQICGDENNKTGEISRNTNSSTTPAADSNRTSLVRVPKRLNHSPVDVTAIAESSKHSKRRKAESTAEPDLKNSSQYRVAGENLQETDSRDQKSCNQLITFGEKKEFDKNKMVTCNVCVHCVLVTSIYNHVYIHHVKRPVFQCPYKDCGVSSSFAKTKVKIHIRDKHKSVFPELSVTDNRALYREEFKEWRLKCFGPRHNGQTQTPIFTGETHLPNRNQYDKNEATFDSNEQTNSSDVISEQALEADPEPVAQSPCPDTSDTKGVETEEKITCRVCYRPVYQRHFSPHIFAKHIDKPVWICPIQTCGKSYTTRPQNAKYHLEKHHSNQLGIQMIDNRHLYKMEYQQWKQKCFPANIWKKKLATQNSSRQPPKRSSLYTCAICAKMIGSNTKQHIYSDHIQQPVFFCPHCPFTSTRTISNVQYHIQKYHPQEPPQQILDKRHLYAEEYKQWKLKCFSNNHKEFAVKAEESNVSEMTTSSTHSTARIMRCHLCEKDLALPIPKSRGVIIQRHIYTIHIRKPVIRCPSEGCVASEFYNPGNMKTHIQRIHPGEGLQPIDDRQLYQEKFETLYKECFGEESTSTEEKEGEGDFSVESGREGLLNSEVDVLKRAKELIEQDFDKLCQETKLV